MRFTDEYHAFFAELSHYQSNHYGSYDTTNLMKSYIGLPPEFKKCMRPNKLQLDNAYRGDDGINIKPVMSFVWNVDAKKAKNNASFYGSKVISLRNNIKSYSGALDTDWNKFIKFFGKKQWHKIADHYAIGDDENELLIFGAIIKPI